MANIIQQFKNAGGDNIYPVAYAQGGMKMDLLWTNPSPTSAFSASTLSLDLSAYNLVLIVFRKESASINNQLSMVVPIDGLYYDCSNSTGYARNRRFMVQNTGITFDVGQRASTYANPATNNNDIVPYRVYGIKMSYIVPTNVHGIQYVEV